MAKKKSKVQSVLAAIKAEAGAVINKGIPEGNTTGAKRARNEYHFSQGAMGVVEDVERALVEERTSWEAKEEVLNAENNTSFWKGIVVGALCAAPIITLCFKWLYTSIG
jgi:hypothetical protein